MPTCKRCGWTAATAEMRRSPKGGHFCKDKSTCIGRQTMQEVWSTFGKRKKR